MTETHPSSTAPHLAPHLASHLASHLAPAISIRGLSKYFGGRSNIQALDNIAFDIPKGKIVGILGPNGAGKTTLIRILTTLMKPDSGTATLAGHDILKNPQEVRQQVGVVFQDNHFNRYLTIWDNLILHADLHGLSAAEGRDQATHWLKKIGLYERRHDMTDRLSGGMQRRIALIRALLHQPAILFLDEPSTGLDPSVRREIWDTIRAMRDQSTTVVLTTHYMEEAEYLSDEIVMMQHGTVVMQGTSEEIKLNAQQALHQHGIEYTLTVRNPDAALYRERLSGNGIAMENIHLVDEHTLRFCCASPAQLGQLVAEIPPDQLVNLGQAQMNLEDVFISLAQ